MQLIRTTIFTFVIVSICLLVTRQYWLPIVVTQILNRGGSDTSTSKEVSDVEKELGSNAYRYQCQDGTKFTAAPNQDRSALSIIPASSLDRIPLVTLKKVSATAGARYEAPGVTFVGHGEIVTLTLGKVTTTCYPIASQENAPLNFGN